jgi:16S rRNA processing protein RimM
MNIPLDQWLPIGKIVAPQGLRGEVRVYPESQFPERFLVPGQRWILRPQASTVEPIQLLAGRILGKGNVYGLRFLGIEDRTQAEALRGSQLFVSLEDRPPLDAGEFHYLDLIGLAVIDQGTGQRLGVVVDLINGGNDLLEVSLESSGRRVLIPFVEAIVPVVDVPGQRIEVTPPPGLLEL